MRSLRKLAIWFPSKKAEGELEGLGALAQLRELLLIDTTPSAAGLESLARLTRLEELRFSAVVVGGRKVGPIDTKATATRRAALRRALPKHDAERHPRSLRGQPEELRQGTLTLLEPLS
jgi:hypothetical protein